MLNMVQRPNNSRNSCNSRRSGNWNDPVSGAVATVFIDDFEFQSAVDLVFESFEP